MDNLKEKKEIIEMECGANFAYILEDNSNFMQTDYKVLQSQNNGGFVKCMKMLYNGKIQLYYFAEELRSFSSMICSLDAESFMIIINNLFSDILTVKHNGFLSCHNINISFDRIYVDPNTFKVSLVYMPIKSKNFSSLTTFENELRTSLVRLINNHPDLSSNERVISFSSDLSNGMLSLEDLENRTKIGVKKNLKTDSSMNTNNENEKLFIVSLNAPTRVEIEITKNSFVIGKKAEVVDGVISFNNMISRSHCRINRIGNQYTITDLQSANGTYVNKKKLQPNQPCYIKNGDVIRLANSDFQVLFSRGG